MSVARQFCTFYLGNDFFGVDVQKVQEVLRYQQQTRVPLAPKTIRGLINLRGQIVTALDLRCRLGLGEAAEDTMPINVVVRTEDGVMSLLVDEIGDVVEVADEDFEPIPETVAGVARELIIGTYKLADQLLMILDTDKTVNLEHVNKQTCEHG
jgi:purine-binding chemotaxis protein CheW